MTFLLYFFRHVTKHRPVLKWLVTQGCLTLICTTRKVNCEGSYKGQEEQSCLRPTRDSSFMQ